jgi:hypothetical protein
MSSAVELLFDTSISYPVNELHRASVWSFSYYEYLWSNTCVSTLGTGSFSGVKRPGRGVDHPPLYSAKVKESVELYLYSTFGPSWLFLGWTLPFTCVYCVRRGRGGEQCKRNSELLASTCFLSVVEENTYISFWKQLWFVENCFDIKHAATVMWI